MAFSFDPKAVLARPGIRPRPRPTPPTPPTVAPREAETVGTIGTVGRPRVASGATGTKPLADFDAFEERAAIREHDGGETREEAERAAAAERGFADPAEFCHAQKGAMADPARLAGLLAEHGPMTQGAAGAALGWGGTRAWQAEDALLRRRLIAYDRIGRAALSEAWAAFERANDPMDPEAWR